jgi:hypothetical protein
MTDNLLEDEIVFKNRIILREIFIKRLTSRYLDLISKFNTLTRSEMAQHIKEILNEIDLIEISLLKAENLEKLKEFDLAYQISLSKKISQNIQNVKTEIQEGTVKLQGALQEKEYKIQCEETAKIVNCLKTREELTKEVDKLQDDINKIENKDKIIMNKLDSQTKKLSLLVKLVNDLKTGVEVEDDYIYSEDKMVVD